MLERILQLKNLLDDPEIKAKEITTNEWSLISELVRILKPFKKASVKMQNSNAAFTELYVIIKVLEMDVKKIGIYQVIYIFLIRFSSFITSSLPFFYAFRLFCNFIHFVKFFVDSPLANALFNSVRERLAPIMESEMFKAAMLLDPRINMDLQSKDQEIGIRYLISLAARLNLITASLEPQDAPNTSE